MKKGKTTNNKTKKKNCKAEKSEDGKTLFGCRCAVVFCFAEMQLYRAARENQKNTLGKAIFEGN